MIISEPRENFPTCSVGILIHNIKYMHYYQIISVHTYTIHIIRKGIRRRMWDKNEGEDYNDNKARLQ